MTIPRTDTAGDMRSTSPADQPVRGALMLGEVTDGRDNNFNLIRIVAAGAVVVSHAFPIALGEGTPEPFQQATGRSLGWIAVAIFFAISGFLITRSFDRKSRITRWLSARVMRLFPALIVVLALTALVYGPIFTTLPIGMYFSDPATYAYIPRNLSLAFLQFELPGVFVGNPLPGAINGSLWTLVHEVACYAGVLALGLSGMLASRRRFAVFLAIYFTAVFATALSAIEASLPHRLVTFRDLSLPFVFGIMLYRWRAHVPLSWIAGAALGGFAWLMSGTPYFDFAFVAAIAYATFLIAYRVTGPVRTYNRAGDYSYGLYIYAFPVQQAVAALTGDHGPAHNMIVSLPATLLLAVLSWHWVEKPALDRRYGLADRFERWTGVLLRHPKRIGQS